MRLWPFALAYIVLVAQPASAGQGDGWYSTLDEAEKSSRERGVPVLIHFHAWYCGPCQRMDREVFPDDEVADELATSVAAVKIDVTHQPEAAGKFAATTVPRDVLVLPDGGVKTLNVGYLSKTSYLSMLRNTRHLTAKRTNEPKTKENSLKTGHGSSAGSEAPSPSVGKNDEPMEKFTEPDAGLDAGRLPVGLDGYCPVRLLKTRQWVKGEQQFCVEHRSITYWLASDADRQAFLQSPSSYAPQDLGCDPVVLTTEQIARAGSIRYGVFFDEKLFLFQSEENRAEFKTNPLNYVRIRSALRAEQIGGARIQ